MYAHITYSFARSVLSRQLVRRLVTDNILQTVVESSVLVRSCQQEWAKLLKTRYFRIVQLADVKCNLGTSSNAYCLPSLNLVCAIVTKRRFLSTVERHSCLKCSACLCLRHEDFNENNIIRKFKFSKMSCISNKISFFIPFKNARNQNKIF